MQQRRARPRRQIAISGASVTSYAVIEVSSKPGLGFGARATRFPGAYGARPECQSSGRCVVTALDPGVIRFHHLRTSLARRPQAMSGSGLWRRAQVLIYAQHISERVF
jgi:hypothetical protein